MLFGLIIKFLFKSMGDYGVIVVTKNWDLGVCYGYGD